MQPRHMQSFDIDAVVALHKRAFPGFFLTRMGDGFLKAYYRSVMDYDGRIALVLREQGTDRLLGFAVGFRDPAAFYAAFASRKRSLFPLILLAALRDPTLVLQIWRNTRRVETKVERGRDEVELSSIASDVFGQGIGGILLSTFVAEAAHMKASRISLTTDADGNDAVRRFYEAHSFALDGTETRGGRTLCTYSRPLG